MSRNAEYQLEQLKPFVGAKITGLVTDEDGEYFGLRVKQGKQETILWINGDDEANYCGSVDIQKV